MVEDEGDPVGEGGGTGGSRQASELTVLSKRLRDSREAVGMSRAEVAKRIGVNEVSLYRWETGENRPRAKGLSDLARVYGRSVEWLVGSQTPVDLPPWDGTLVSEDVDLGVWDMIAVPVVSAVAGHGAPVFDDTAQRWRPYRVSDLSFPGSHPRDLCLVRVWGDSMKPVLPHDSLALVDRGAREFENLKLYLVSIPHEGLVVRRAAEGDGWYLLADDFHWKPVLMSRTVLVHGRVVEIIQRPP